MDRPLRSNFASDRVFSRKASKLRAPLAWQGHVGMQPRLQTWPRLWLCALVFWGCSAAAPLPAQAVAHNSAGALALQQGDLETAGARLEVALEYHPEFVEALSNLGLVELARGNFERARQLLERARRLNPDVAQPHHGLGVLAERAHRPDTASEHYREALRVDPGFAAARANLARLLLHAGRVEHALVQFRKLREVDASNLVGQVGMVECLLRLGRTAEALADLRQAEAELGPHPQLQVLRARLHLRAGELAAAEQLLTPLTTTRDDVAVGALAWLAVVQLAKPEPEAALLSIGRALELDRDHPLALFAAAVALDEVGDPYAAAWLERAATANPHNAELQRRLAAHTKGGQSRRDD